ncbi:MAG: hypothetical protein AAGG06_18670 [Pseudomonadota bacterium]
MSRICACGGAGCRCSACEKTPQTLSDLGSLTSIETLDHGLETLALVGTQFDDALITTRNDGALVSGRGGYAALQRRDSPWRLSRKRVTVRVDQDRTVRLARSAATQAGLPGSLVVADGAGAILHRIQYVSDHDRHIAACLEAKAGPQVEIADTAEPADNVLSLTVIRKARTSWDGADTGAHLNDLLDTDCGRRRRQCLPHIGKDRAWPIVGEVMPSFLYYLCEHAVRYVPLVPSMGLLQASMTSIDHVMLRQNTLVASGRGGLFSLDLKAVGSTWVVASGPNWQIEFYGADQRAVAVIIVDPTADTAHWRALLSSLPRAA